MTKRAFSAAELGALAERAARVALDVSKDEAFRLLDRGALDGTAIGFELRALRALMGQ